jgi:hypothetical protein
LPCPEKEAAVNIRIIPPENSGVGAQEVKIKTEAMADNRFERYDVR